MTHAETILRDGTSPATPPKARAYLAINVLLLLFYFTGLACGFWVEFPFVLLLGYLEFDPFSAIVCIAPLFYSLATIRANRNGDAKRATRHSRIALCGSYLLAFYMGLTLGHFFLPA